MALVASVGPPSSDEPVGADQVASVAKALAHPARLRILDRLGPGAPQLAGDIVGECPLAQSTVSEHLRVLRQAGLVLTRRDGPRIWYRLNRAALRDFAATVEQIGSHRRVGPRR